VGAMLGCLIPVLVLIMVMGILVCLR
jgi:hypothetical protein